MTLSFDLSVWLCAKSRSETWRRYISKNLVELFSSRMSQSYTFDGMSLLESFSLSYSPQPCYPLGAINRNPAADAKKTSSGLKPNKAALRPWKVPSTSCLLNLLHWSKTNGKTQGSTGDKWCTKGLWEFYFLKISFAFHCCIPNLSQELLHCSVNTSTHVDMSFFDAFCPLRNKHNTNMF